MTPAQKKRLKDIHRRLWMKRGFGQLTPDDIASSVEDLIEALTDICGVCSGTQTDIMGDTCRHCGEDL